MADCSPTMVETTLSRLPYAGRAGHHMVRARSILQYQAMRVTVLSILAWWHSPPPWPSPGQLDTPSDQGRKKVQTNLQRSDQHICF